MATSILTSRKLVSTQSSNNMNYVHTYHDEEKQSLVEHLNFLLKKDKLLKSRIPIDPKSDIIFDSLKDGVILCKLINSIKSNTINESTIKLNNIDKLNIFEKNVNLENCLKGAKKIGCSIVNIGPVDIQEGKRHLILSILWQLVKIDLMNKVSKLAYRVKAEMLDLGETEKIEELVPDEILLRWVNHHLSESKQSPSRRITNFSSDIKDCEVYILLFHQLSPSVCGLELLEINDINERVKLFLESIDRIDCKKFISQQDIISGNARLNMAFVAYIFNRFNQVEPMVPSVEVSKVADQQLTEDQKEIVKLDEEIQRYQNRHFESIEVYEEIKKRIELTQLQDQELEEQFQEKVELIQQEFQQQKSEYEIQIQLLEQQLTMIEQQTGPNEIELLQQLEQEKNEIAALESTISNTVELEYNEIKSLNESNQKELEQLKLNTENNEKELETIKNQLNQEKQEVLNKLESTGLLETKRKLEEVKQAAATIETQIQTLKQSEKQLKVELTENKEDKHRISLAKKKIQDELSRAKDNTEKMIKNKVETEKIIDKTTKQVRDLRYEVDRIQNDKVYIQQQTEVIKIETIEAEEDLQQTIVQKKRLITKKQETTQILMEKEMELDQVLVDKDVKLDATKQKNRETIEKMKREFESTKLDIQLEKDKIKSQLLTAHSELVKQEIAAENERIQVDLLEMKQKDLKFDIHYQTIVKEQTEKEAEKIKKEKEKSNQLLSQEKEINQLLQDKNNQLYKEKSILRQEKTQAIVDALDALKQTKALEDQVADINNQVDETLINKQKLELLAIEDSAELELKKAEFKDEKKRLKQLKLSKQHEEKQLLEKVDQDFSKDLYKLKSQKESIEKDIQEKQIQSEDLEIKEQRFADRLAKTEKEISSKKLLIEKKEKENQKIQQEKQKLESILNQAKDMFSESKKEKDQTLKEREVTQNKHKLLMETVGSTTKTKKSLEQTKKDLEDRMAKLAALKSENELQHKKKMTDMQQKSKEELDKERAQHEKEQQRLAEKLSRQLEEDQESLIKKNESQIQRMLDSIEKNKSEQQRIEERIQKEKEEHQLALEKKKRKDEREKKKLKEKLELEKLEKLEQYNKNKKELLNGNNNNSNEEDGANNNE